MIKKGDILLVSNLLDPISWMIKGFTHNKWSHTTWVLNDKQILESRTSGVIVTPIKKYLNGKFYKTKLVRLKGIRKEKIDKAMKIGLKYERGRTYFQFIWTLILIGFGYARRSPIMSCSGLIANCLSQVGFYFKKYKNPLLITPADIDKSKNTINIPTK